MHEIDLNAILKNYKEFEFDCVIFAFAELKRRKLELSVRLLNNANELAVSNNYKDIEQALLNFLQKNYCATYLDYYNSKASIEAKHKYGLVQIAKKNENKLNTEKFQSAGRKMKSIVLVIAFTYLIIILIAIFGMNKQDNLETIKLIWGIMAIIFLLSNVIVLSMFYNVGDELESVVLE